MTLDRRRRAAVYGLLGVLGEVVFTGIADVRRSRDLRLRAHRTLWSFPLYALAQPLFEPAHDRLRARPPAVRAAAYGVGFLGVEYASGLLLRRALGAAPWDYGYARRNVGGLIRPDWLPLWAGVGLALERVHDRLTASTGARRARRGSSRRR